MPVENCPSMALTASTLDITHPAALTPTNGASATCIPIPITAISQDLKKVSNSQGTGGLAQVRKVTDIPLITA